MYGDTAVMRKRSGQLREQSTDIKMLADHWWPGRPGNAPQGRAPAGRRRPLVVHHPRGGGEPIQIPREWDDSGLITFEEFCELIRTPQRTVRDWRQRGIGPRWARFNGCGLLYITVAEARRFLRSAIAPSAEGRLS